MKFDLRTPCKNCPFRTDDTAIRFACRERAEGISESAYRNGFPCHLSAEHAEDDCGESNGYEFGEETQHCAGALIMFGHDGSGTVPFEWLDNKERDRISEQLDWSAPVFLSEEDFLEANDQTTTEDTP